MRPFEEIPRRLDDLGRTVKILQMTGFLVKIENARIENAEAGFDTVALNLQNLGGEIRAKAEELRSSSSAIASRISQNLRVIWENQQEHNEYTKLILNRILSSLNHLRDKHRSSAVTLQDFSSRYRKIGERIGEIIVSLQFHDIKG